MIESGNSIEALTFSCDLQDLTYYTDYPWVDILLTANGEELLSGRYYACNGAVDVYDIPPLFDRFADTPDPCLIECELTSANGDERVRESFTVIYCSRSLGLATPYGWLAENFLTLTPVRRIAPEGFVTVAWVANSAEGSLLMAEAVYIDDREVRRTYRWGHSGSGMLPHARQLVQRTVTMKQVVQTLKTKCAVTAPTLLSVTLSSGARRVTCFVDPMLSGVVPFYFYNCFGIPDHMALPRKTTVKLISESSVADLGQRSLLYDVSRRREHEVESAPLTPSEQEQVLQMLTSPSVYLPANPSDPALPMYDSDIEVHSLILITEQTAEFPDDADSLPAVKFTWRYSSNTL